MLSVAALTHAIEAAPEVPYPPVAGAPMRASWAGKCARQITYMLRDEPADRPVAARTQFALAVGHAVHEVVQAALQRLHPEGIAEQEGVLGDAGDGRPLVGCHADYAYGRVVVEIKSMQTYAFRQDVRQEHVLQAGLCGLALGAAFVELVYVDKARGDIAVTRLGTDLWQDAARAELARFERLWALHRAGELGDPIDQDRKVWQCRFCAFARPCQPPRLFAIDGDAPF